MTKSVLSQIRLVGVITRPLRTLVPIWIYGIFMPWWVLTTSRNFGTASWLTPTDESLLLWAILAPLCSGVFISGIFHEVLHEPFARFVPGIGRAIRRWHGSVIAILAGVCAWIVHHQHPEVGLIASWGFAVGSLAATAPAMHRSLTWGRFAARASLWTAALVGSMRYSADIHHLLAGRPLLASGLGVLVAAVALGLAYGRRALHARSKIVYFCAQSRLLSRHGQAATRRIWMERRSAQKPATAANFPHNNGTNRFWVVAQLNAMNAAGRIRLTILAQFGVGLILPILLELALAAARSHPAMGWHWGAVWRSLAESGRGGIEHDGLGFVMPFFFAIMLGVYGALFAPLVRLRYPISRDRLAWTAFASSFFQSWTYRAAFTTGTILSIGFACAMSGTALGFSSLGQYAAAGMVLVPAFELLRCLGAAWRIQVYLTLCILLVALAGAAAAAGALRPGWSIHVLTPLGVFASVVATAAAIYANWRIVRWLYRRRDLTTLLGALTPFARG
jgi:hypothetical protein